MDKKYILFDLDGTLTDPKIGITRCVQYALAAAGIDEPNLDKLECYIGPPLDVSFKKFHGMSEKESWNAVAKYRERFNDIGIFENAVIDGIVPCLETLRAAGKILILATCKPEVFAFRIMEHFELEKYFERMVGSELDGTRKHKNEVIEEVFNRLSELTGEDIIDMKADAIMVGDRDQDVNGAHEAGIEVVGVKFGYAADGELEEAGADYIVETVPELTAVLLSDN